jgi:hypothetical protein
MLKSTPSSLTEVLYHRLSRLVNNQRLAPKCSLWPLEALNQISVDRDSGKKYNPFWLEGQGNCRYLEWAMGLGPGRKKHLESAISICLLAILILIGVGVLVKQLDADMSRFGIEAPTAKISEIQTSTTEVPFQAASLKPSGFDLLSGTEVYDTENLYEKINGKAPLYTESGFEELLTQRFISNDDQSLWMELYLFDMADIKNAFSVYSVQRRAEADTISLFHTSFGYRSSNAIYFARGKYYAELIGSSESNRLFEAMTEVAKNIKSELPVDKSAEIPELSLFPTENFTVGSIKLYLTNTFGFEGLTDTFTARYEIDGESISAFFSKRTSPEDAEETAKRYHKFLIENGAAVKPAHNKILADHVLDFYDTTEIVLSTGPFVVGIHEAESQDAAEKLATVLINKLSEAAKND